MSAFSHALSWWVLYHLQEHVSTVLWLHDFVFCLSFSFLLSLAPGSGSEVGRQTERGGHGPETAREPQPLFEWGFSLGTVLSLSLVLQAKERDVEMHSCLISSPSFFLVLLPPWPNSLWVNTSVTCSLKSPPGISHFWFCFHLAFLVVFAIKFPLNRFCCTQNFFYCQRPRVHMSALLSQHTMSKSPSIVSDWNNKNHSNSITLDQKRKVIMTEWVVYGNCSEQSVCMAIFYKCLS